jgi:quercetin dioxygenase-like cupin family protein
MLCVGVSLVAWGCRPEATGPSAPTAPVDQPLSSIRRTILGRTPAHEAGWETRLYLIEYPPGAVAPPHVHPVAGVGWVVEGELESAFGDAPATTAHRGQSFTDLADVPHRVFRNKDPDRPLRFVIAYTIRVGEENFHPLP